MAVDQFQFHEISEVDHRILNPFSDEKLTVLGRICSTGGPSTHVDLACGKGEMLCRWAAAHGNSGLGVDLSASFIEVARRRAVELGVASAVQFLQADAGAFDPGERRFGIVSCIGATWIGGGLVGTIELMKRMSTSDALLLVGEKKCRCRAGGPWPTSARKSQPGVIAGGYRRPRP